MPNLKINVDEMVWAERREALTAALGPLRAMLCERLDVGVAACQLALQPVAGLPTNRSSAPRSRAAATERTRDFLEAVCGTLRDRLSEASGGASTAVRCTTLDPLGYLAIEVGLASPGLRRTPGCSSTGFLRPRLPPPASESEPPLAAAGAGVLRRTSGRQNPDVAPTPQKDPDHARETEARVGHHL